MEEIDVKIVFRKLLKRWYWFALSLLGTLGMASFYLAVTNKVYLVESSIQLKDQSLNDKELPNRKFLSGLELLSSGSELEDEIGVLTSYATILQSLDQLGTEVSYFEHPNLPANLGKLFTKELYPAPFKVLLDTGAWQLLHAPVHITFLSKEQFRLTIAATQEPVLLYHPHSREVLQHEAAVSLDTVLSINQPLHTPFLSLSVTKLDLAALQSMSTYYIRIASLHDVAENYRKALKKEQLSEKSNIIQLSLKSTVPQKDIDFLNMLSRVYIANDVKKKNQLGERTIAFIDFQLQGVTDSLRSAENTLEVFRAKSNIIDIEQTSHTLSEQLYVLEEKQAQLLVQNKYYQYMSDYLSRNDDITDIVAPSSVGIQDELLNSLLLQLSVLNEEKITKDFSSSKQNPIMQVLEKKIRATKQALIDNIDNLIESNKIGLQDNGRRVAELKQVISRLPENERNLTDIKRRFTFNDNIYNYLLQKRAEAGIAIASNVPDKSVVDVARKIGAGPIGPNRVFILFVALVAGLMLPVGLIVTAELLETRLESTDQLEKWTDLPLIESIAHLKAREMQNRYTGESYLAHAFRYVRHHLEMLRLHGAVKTIGVSSAKSGEGKTFCALHLAITMAQSGKQVLLIDADLHHPSLAGMLALQPAQGLGDYLQVGDKLLVQDTPYAGLKFIAAGTPQSNPSDLLVHPRLEALLSSLRETYDCIILDTPPLGLVADYLQLAKHTDYTLLVVRQDLTKKEDVQRLARLVKSHMIKSGLLYNGATTKEEYSRYYKKPIPSKKLSA